MKTLIIIPTYNERDNIEPILFDIHAIVPDVHILVIDDGSPDGTGELVDELATRHAHLRVIHRTGKQGLGSAYVLGFRYAMDHNYELVFEMDADFSHDPRYLPEFLRQAEEADLVIGSRYIKGGATPNWSAMRRFISGGGNIFSRTVLRIPIHDCTSGFRCYHTRALATLHLDRMLAQGYAFQVEMAYAVWKSGYRIYEVPIIFMDRRVGQSKMSGKIFNEAFRWVITTFFQGSPVVASKADRNAVLETERQLKRYRALPPGTDLRDYPTLPSVRRVSSTSR